MTEKIKTRIAPSPTGLFHIGTARTALFNYLFSKKYGGEFILRLEDTDENRSEKEYEKNILDSLKWLGLSYDKIFRQSERRDIYKKYITKLLEEGKAYKSKEPSKENPNEEIEIIRFKNKEKVITFKDEIRGEINMDIEDLGDFVIAKDETHPLYNLAVVIDDFEMGITHIIRGDDHISNTPRQIALLKSIGNKIPVYIHIPLIHSKDGGKLSKRKQAVSVVDFKKEGYLSESVVNFMVLLGWRGDSVKEIYSMKELIEDFSIKGIQKKEAIFDTDKLNYFNKHYLKKLTYIKKSMIIFNVLYRVMLKERRKLNLLSLIGVLHTKRNFFINELFDRYSTTKEMEDAFRVKEYDYIFYFTFPNEEVLFKHSPKKEVVKNLKKILVVFNSIKVLNIDNLKKRVTALVDEKGKREIFWPFRVLLTNKEKSPDPITVSMTLGKKEVLRRLRYIIDKYD